MDWYLQVLRKYAQFSGRARRTEYWMFVLFNFIVALALGFADAFLGTGGWLEVLYALAVFLPAVAVAVRRLHDTNRSGWWLLIAFVPLVGAIVLILFAVQDSTPGPNEYGPHPK